MNSQLPLRQLPSRDNPILNSQKSGDDLLNLKPPESSGSSSSSSLTSSSSNVSDLLVGSREDAHHSPSSLVHNRPKPGLATFGVYKSGTESNRYQQESFKIQDDSFSGRVGLVLEQSRSLEPPRNMPGIVKRNSRFSEIRRRVSKGSKHSIDEIPENRKQRLSIDGEILKEALTVPATKAESPAAKSGFFKKRKTTVLTPAQIELLDQKIFKPSVRQRTKSYTSGMDKGRRRSQFLQRISNIAARGSITSNNEENPAFIFKQLLKKVNPVSLEKAEKDLKQRYFRKVKKFVIEAALAPFQILTPDSLFPRFWNIFVLLLVVYDSLIKPFEVAFFIDNREVYFLLISDLVSTILFILDICLNFRTAFYDKGVLITSGRAIAKNYLLGSFRWDFIVVIADLFALVSGDRYAYYFKIFSVIRLYKLGSLVLRTEDFMNLSRKMQAGLKMIRLLGTIIIVAHWMACFFHLIAYTQEDKQNTWLYDQGLLNTPKFHRYVAALYWSTATMVTVGYGDIYPISSLERIYTIGAMLIASAVFGYSLNTVANILKEINYERNQRREKITNVKHYMNQKHLGKSIQTRVKNYMQYIIDSRALYKPDEEEFLELLSQGLKDEIVTDVNGKILASSKIFAVNFSHKASLHLAKYMKEIFLGPEEILFNEGELLDCSLYFIAYGKMQLFHQVRNFPTLEKGAQFGEISFFSGQPRTASAKSLFFTNLYSLARDVSLENLTGIPSDFEMFHFIKDRINLNGDYSHIELICFSCNNKGHLAKNCHELHYVPKRTQIINIYLMRKEARMQQYKRRNRPKFKATQNIARLSEIAEMIQEDYSDYTISDEELSQDSLDIVLERNLFIVPGAEKNDLKNRKTERRNKSARYSAQALIGEIINANNAIGTTNRQSYASQNVTKEEIGESRLLTKPGQIDFLFFTVDQVENFEVYYPHYNIKNLVQRLEKEKLQNILKGSLGTAKALVLKNFGSAMKNLNRRGTRSSMYSTQVLPALQKQETIRGKRKNQNKESDDRFVHQSLGTQMQQAIVRAKSIKKSFRQKTFGEDQDSDSHQVTDEPERDTTDQNAGNYEEQILKLDPSQDDGTMSKRELKEEGKVAKEKVQLEKLLNLRPRTLSQLKYENSGMTSHVLPSSYRMTDRTEQIDSMLKITKKVNGQDSLRKRGTALHKFQTKNSLDKELLIDPSQPIPANLENAILRAMIRQGQVRHDGNSKRRSRPLSVEKIDDMKRAIHKFEIPKIVRNLLESPIKTTKTANFGS